MRIRISDLKERALLRGPEYEQEVMSKGTVDGAFLFINKGDYDALVIKWAKMPLTGSNQVRGLGDIVYKVANPIARAIDRVAGTKIQGCGGCAKRREALNKAMPFTK